VRMLGNVYTMEGSIWSITAKGVYGASKDILDISKSTPLCKTTLNAKPSYSLFGPAAFRFVCQSAFSFLSCDLTNAMVKKTRMVEKA
jgi:hypothetical protein